MKTQEELEEFARCYENKSHGQFLLIGTPRQFLGSLLLCLLNPLALLGLFPLGVAVGIIFLCLLAWKGWEGEAIRHLLLWWLLWAGILYAAILILRCIIWEHSKKRFRQYSPALPPDAASATGGQESPIPLHWQHDECHGSWQGEALVYAPARALYGWQLVVEDCEGTLIGLPEKACACQANEIPGLRSSYSIIYRLEPGWHRLSFTLHPAHSSPPEGVLKAL